MNFSELASGLKPYIVKWIEEGGVGGHGFAPSPHDISSGHHTGVLADAQGPQFLKTDGTRQLTGNLSVLAGVTIDGVDLSVFKSAYDTHLLSDSHPDYVHITAARNITAVHTFNPPVAGAPFLLSATGQGQTVTGLRADQLNKSVLAGTGLTGGGLLTADRTLNVDQAASFSWTGSHIFNNLVYAGSILPVMPDTYDLGDSANYWRKGYISELDAVIFSQNTVSIIGGWLLISKGEGYVSVDVGAADTYVDFGQAMTLNDFVLFRSAGKVEYMQVGSGLGGFSYSVTRNLDGSGANDWPTGTPYVILGNTGNGRIELNANDTPRMSIIQQGASYNAQTELVRIGDLLNNWGYASSAYGAAFGEYGAGKANITIDPTNGIRLRRYATDVIKLDSTGAYFSSLIQMTGSGASLAIGATPPTSSSLGTGLWLDRTGIFSLASNVRQVWIDAVTGKFHAGGGDLFADVNGLNLPVDTNIDGYSGGPTSIKWKNSSYETNRIIAYSNNVAQSTAIRLESLFPWDPGGSDFGSGGIELIAWSTTNGIANAVSHTMKFTNAISIDGQFLPGADGWQADNGWNYASSTTFTRSGDFTKRFPKGTKIKLDQSSTTKYFYVIGASYSSPNTTITVTGGSDYSLTNTAISNCYFSYAETPQDFPVYFNWTPTLTGFSVNPGSSVYRFCLIGNRFEGVVHQGTDGTSNDTVLNISIPVTAKAGSSWQGASGYAVNGGTVLTAASRWYIGGGNNYIQFVSNMASGTWSNTGGKRVRAIVSCEI